jgi:hypothetical protein
MPAPGVAPNGDKRCYALQRYAIIATMNKLMVFSLLATFIVSGCCLEECRLAHAFPPGEAGDPSLARCLPSGVRLGDIVESKPAGLHPQFNDRVTVGRKLAELNASCSGGKLRDGSGREILFYRVRGCWGNPPVDYRDILKRQRKELHELRERYTVIEMTCNPSGRPIQ